MVEMQSLYLLTESTPAVALSDRNLVQNLMTQPSSLEKREILLDFVSYLIILSHLTPLACFFPNQFVLFNLNNALEVYLGQVARKLSSLGCLSYNFDIQFILHVTTGKESG